MRSFQLSKRSAAGTWLADLTLDDGSQRTIDTKQNAKGPAEKRAKWILRHTIARRRHAARVALKKKGKPIPPDLAPKQPGRRKPAAAAPPAEKRKPGRPRKAPAAAAAPARPTLDHEAIAARLRSLTQAAPPAEEPEPAPAPAPAAADQGELGEDDPTPVHRPPIAADEAPPMPESKPEVLTPEVLPPAGADEDAEMFSALAGTLFVAGFIRVQREIADEAEPPLELADAHPGSVGWVQGTVERRVRKIFGDRVIGDGTKFVLGSLGIIFSMWAGARVKTAAPASAEASANTESERERSAAADADDFDAPPAAMVHQNGAPTPGPRAAAAGKFR